MTLTGTIEDPSSSTASASLFQGELGAFNSVESRTLFDTVGIIKWPNFTFGLSLSDIKVNNRTNILAMLMESQHVVGYSQILFYKYLHNIHHCAHLKEDKKM